MFSKGLKDIKTDIECANESCRVLAACKNNEPQ
jgi:hypothetical protein